MHPFFLGWRRKAGVVTLVMALASMAAWIKSGTAGDVVHISTRRHYHMFFSAAGRLYWWSMTNESGVCRVLWHDENTADELVGVLDKDRPKFQSQVSLDFHERSFAYLNLTIPLTMISAYLILRPGHKQKTQTATQPERLLG
jgi:hypothetical protein